MSTSLQASRPASRRVIKPTEKMVSAMDDKKKKRTRKEVIEEAKEASRVAKEEAANTKRVGINSVAGLEDSMALDDVNTINAYPRHCDGKLYDRTFCLVFLKVKTDIKEQPTVGELVELTDSEEERPCKRTRDSKSKTVNAANVKRPKPKPLGAGNKGALLCQSRESCNLRHGLL